MMNLQKHEAFCSSLRADNEPCDCAIDELAVLDAKVLPLLVASSAKVELIDEVKLLRERWVGR
jgi:hypothetical protein